MTIQLILENAIILSIFGLSFTLIAFLFTYAFLKTRQPSYLHIQTGHLGITLDENIVYQYLNLLAKKLPKSTSPFQFKL